MRPRDARSPRQQSRLARPRDRLKIETRAFIDGVHVDAISKRVFERASVIDGRALAAVVDAPFLELPRDPTERDVDRRDYMLAERLKVDSAGNIVLTA